jgi:hypothetical protein
LQRVQIVDLDELFRLNAQNLAAPSTAGQNLVLLLGGSGAGKSTTIHYFAGSEMAPIVNDRGSDVVHIEPVRIPNTTLRRIRCSPEARSETRFLTVARVAFLDVDILNPGHFQLCDSPGFGDSGGAAVEICNCLGIIRVVRECNTVKPVIVLSSQVR